MSFADRILQFITGLNLPVALPPGIEVMNPFRDMLTLEICNEFYQKFYPDDHLRWMIVGINPGRFGGGVTGIPFTDPIRLQNECGILNPWQKKQELSSLFVYEVINAFGGPRAFYQKFYITAISPLGFTKNEKNLNYYDDRSLQESIRDFVIDCVNRQLQFGIHRNAVFCLGDGKNYKYLSALNKEKKIFEAVIPLSHPRFIMQYRLKRKAHYIQYYLDQFSLYAT